MLLILFFWRISSADLLPPHRENLDRRKGRAVRLFAQAVYHAAMGAHGDAIAKRNEKKDNVKKGEKKKFKDRNSIGKTKKKVGSAGKYTTRTQAVKKLQVTLKDFRRLCILKGIYPREPKKKFKGSNTTYYFAKDIQFLIHEPLLEKFREQKSFLKKIRRATGRLEKKQAMRLDARRPEYKLDHLIRERYPTFADALRDLDDALCLVFLFASLVPDKMIPVKRIQHCARLAREFQAYVARAKCLRHTFISIKGIYYQADVMGVTVTWVVPHSFAQQPTMTVDYRIMLSFLELYEALLTFVNFKLYHARGLHYPPPINAESDGSGAFLTALAMKPAEANAGSGAPRAAGAAPLGAPLALPPPRLGVAAPSASEDAPAAPTGAQLKSLQKKLQGMDQGAAGGSGAAAEGGAAAAEEPDVALQEMLDEAAPAGSTGALFGDCVFFCGRETTVASLEFVVLSCGGKLGWEGEGSTLTAADKAVTHQIVDRPMPAERMQAGREYVQPQWVFDCINARALLPTHAYQPNKQCPPHLSPFVDGAEGYVPGERLHSAMTGEAEDDEEAVDGEDGGMDVAGEEDEEEEDDDEDDEDEDDEDEDEDDEEAAQYKRELAAEKAGVAAAPAKGKKAGAMSSEEKAAAEEKELAKLMMTRKKQRLYERMQYGIKKKAAATDVLKQKRADIDAEGGSKKKKGKKA